MTTLPGLVLALLIQATPLTEPPVVTALMGDWRGSGTVNGQGSSITMTWERAVSGAFVRLRFRNEMAPGNGRPAMVFEGHGYYQIARPDGGVGTWMDSRGLMLPVEVALEARTLTSDWGSATTERGRTVYRLVEADLLEVTDFVRGRDGEYREFGRSRLRRVTSGGRAPRGSPAGCV
jgi:hypothetical protein